MQLIRNIQNKSEHGLNLDNESEKDSLTW